MRRQQAGLVFAQSWSAQRYWCHGRRRDGSAAGNRAEMSPAYISPPVVVSVHQPTGRGGRDTSSPEPCW